MAFPDVWMNELLSKNDIVAVVSSYIELKPKGRRLWGLCPLHGEKTASFSVSPDKQLFYCFGCHAGGSVIQFVMDMEHLGFGEAVRFLANRVNMDLPEETDDGAVRRERAYRERLYEATRLAARFFMETLLGPDGAPGRAYLAKRNISPDSVKRFGLGLAPDGWDMLKNHLFAQGFTQQELLDAGLLVKNEQKNSVYDAYRNRLIFPIVGTNGRVLGFGARTLADDTPKYINTGDTPLYNKRLNLYGLSQQKGKKLSDLVIVEGYTDVIGLYEAGVTNAVASLGTALTVQQARLVKRYVERVFIAYDGDAAGQNATIRGMGILAEEGLDVRVVVFPDKLDPDEFIRRSGKEAFDALKEAAMSLSAFRIASMAAGYKLENENERERFAMESCAFIGGLQPVERERYYEQVARLTGYALEALRAQGARGKQGGETSLRQEDAARRKPRRRLSGQEDNDTERTRAEAQLLLAMLQSRETAIFAVSQNATDLLTVEVYKAFAAFMIGSYAAGKRPNPARFMAEQNERDAQTVAALLREDAPICDPERTVFDCVRRIERFDQNARLAALQEELTDPALVPERRNEILEEVQRITLQSKR